MTPQNISSVQYGWAAAIPAIISLATMIYGEVESSNASNDLRDAQERVMKRQRNLGDWYRSEASKDFLDTQAGSSALSKLKDQYSEASSINKGNAVRGGATAEAQVAQQSELQKRFNQALTQLSGYGTQYKLNLNRNYQNQLKDIMAGNASTYGADVNSWNNFTNNAADSFSSNMGTIDWNQILGG